MKWSFTIPMSYSYNNVIVIHAFHNNTYYNSSFTFLSIFYFFLTLNFIEELSSNDIFLYIYIFVYKYFLFNVLDSPLRKFAPLWTKTKKKNLNEKKRKKWRNIYSRHPFLCDKVDVCMWGGVTFRYKVISSLRFKNVVIEVYKNQIQHKCITIRITISKGKNL